MVTTEVDNFLAKEMDKDQSLRDLLNDNILETEIEKLNEDGFVIEEIMLGTPIAHINQKLAQKYPDKYFNHNMIHTFLRRNRAIVKKLETTNTKLARRHLDAVTKVEEEVEGLYLYTKKLLIKFEREGDNNSMLGAINALNKTLINFAKLKGYGGFAPRDQPQTNIEINIGEKRNAHTLEANFKLVDKKKDDAADLARNITQEIVVEPVIQ